VSAERALEGNTPQWKISDLASGLTGNDHSTSTALRDANRFVIFAFLRPLKRSIPVRFRIARLSLKSFSNRAVISKASADLRAAHRFVVF
jgi:hypothetical protein